MNSKNRSVALVAIETVRWEEENSRASPLVAASSPPRKICVSPLFSFLAKVCVFALWISIAVYYSLWVFFYVTWIQEILLLQNNGFSILLLFFFFFLCFVEAVEWDEGRCMDVLMCVWNLLGLLDLACEVSEYLSVIVLNWIWVTVFIYLV